MTNKANQSKQEIKSIIGTKSIVQKAFEMVTSFNILYSFSYKLNNNNSFFILWFFLYDIRMFGEIYIKASYIRLYYFYII